MELRLMSSTLTLLVGLALSSCGKSEPKQLESGVPKVSVREISAVAQQQELSYSGNIEPDNTAQIGFAVSGIVNNIHVVEGQRVAKGTLLASIDASDYANALAIANAQLEQAEDMYRRLDGLYKKGSLPEKDFIDIKTKVAQARANKSINAKHIRDSRLYSPITGIISAKMVERGSTAAPGVPAFTIIKTDQVYARISVPESEVGTIRNGMSSTVYVPTLEESLSGKISIINPQADAVSKTYVVKIKLPNSSGKLLPGMLAEVKVQTGKSINVVSIPAPSVVRDADGLTYVFVTNEQNKAIRRRVTAGNVTGNNEVIISQGLTAGDKVVVAGQTRLKDGDTVTF